jgi:hypothetical protein
VSISRVKHSIALHSIVTSCYSSLTTPGGTCPPVHFNNVQLPQREEVKYLGLHLDRRLTCQKHIFTKGKQLGIALTKMYWLLGSKSKLSTINTLLTYKTIFKPIWTYGIQLWGTASTSNIQGGPDSIRQFSIIDNQSIQQHTGKWESTFCCR